MFNMSNAPGNTNRMKISSSFPIMNTVKIFKNTLRVYFDCHFFKKRLKKQKISVAATKQQMILKQQLIRTTLQSLSEVKKILY